MINITLNWSDEEFDVSENGIIVLVDTLRASSVITVSLHSGAKEIITVRDEQVARNLKLKNSEFILAGERNGKKLDGFDCGNSPYYLRDHSHNKSVVLTTGNFCNVIDRIADKGLPVLASSIVNAKETAKFINTMSFSNVYFIATGTYHMYGKKFQRPLHTEEDFISSLFIGYELSKMAKVNESILKKHLNVLSKPDKLEKFLWNAPYAQYLLDLDKEMGHNINEKDMQICFEVNKDPCVPILQKKENLFIFKKQA